MAEDEKKKLPAKPMSQMLDLAARLDVPQGKDSASLPGESPLSSASRARRLRNDANPYACLLRAPQGGVTKAHVMKCLDPFRRLLPPLNVDPARLLQLLHALMAAGLKAKRLLDNFEEGLAQGDFADLDLHQLMMSADLPPLPEKSPGSGDGPDLLQPLDAAEYLIVLNQRSLLLWLPCATVRKFDGVRPGPKRQPSFRGEFFKTEGEGGSDEDSLDPDEPLITQDDHFFGAACMAGYADLVALLCELRGSAEYEAPNEYTPLMEACAGGKADVVEALLQHNAEVNTLSEAKNSALVFAAASGHLECLKALLASKKCDLTIRNANGHCALMQAANAGCLESVKELVKYGARSEYVNTTSEFKESPLTLASYKGYVDMVEFLLSIEKGPDHEEELHTALMESCMDGHSQVTKLLLDHKAPVNMASEAFESPLTLACCGGHMEIVEMLVEAGASLEEPNDEGYTPLMEASREGHADIVKFLIENKANVNATTEDHGETAMTLAACSGHREIFEILADAGGDVTLGTQTPLMEASQEGHFDIAKMVVDRATKEQKESIDYKQKLNTSLAIAAESGHVDVVELLMKHGADPNTEVDHRTALMKACKHGFRDVAAYLMEHGADVNRLSSNNDMTALILASGGGFKEIVELLLKHGANPGVIVKDGYTCIMEAAKNGHAEILEILLDHESTIVNASSATDATGNPQSPLPPLPGSNVAGPIRSTARRKKVLVTNPLAAPPSLVKANQTADATTRRTLLQQHMLSGISIDPLKEGETDPNDAFFDLESLLSNGENLPDILAKYFATVGEISRNPDLLTDSSMIDKVIQHWMPYLRSVPPEAHHGGARNPTTQYGMHMQSTTTTTRTPADPPLPSNTPSSYFHTAYENLKRSFSGLPIGRTPDPKTAERKDSVGKKPDVKDAKNQPGPSKTKPPPTADKLPEGVSVTTAAMVDKMMARLSPAQIKRVHETVFLGAARDESLHHSDIKTLLVSHPECRLAIKGYCDNLDLIRGYDQRRTQSESDVTAPSEDFNAIDEADASLFESAITQIKEYLLRFRKIDKAAKAAAAREASNGGKMGVDMMTESNQDTALSFACQHGSVETVLALLKRGANLEHRDKKGFTPLIMAASHGHALLCDELLNAGAELEAQSERTKDTALSLACSSGRKETVDFLLRKGADKEHRNVSDYTPLSLAASGGYVDIVTTLLDAGAEINSRTGSKLGISPLMLAAMNGHSEATKVLLERGSDINAQIETNRNTALTLACFQGRTEVVRLLLQFNANVEHRAKTGLTPLMEAANGGYTEVGELLLEDGADPNTGPVPSSRDTALTIAADKGHDKFVEMLVMRNAQIDARNKKGCTALWLACNSGHTETVKILVEHGADVEIPDNRKSTPLMVAFRKGHSPVVKYMVCHVTQFPSDQDLDRYLTTIVGDKELHPKCNECRQEILAAKEKQAKEAAKAAEALLQMLEEEEEQIRSKKQAKQRKNEKKKAKKQAATKKPEEKAGESDVEKEEEKTEELKAEPEPEPDDPTPSLERASSPQEVIEERVPVLPTTTTLESASPPSSGSDQATAGGAQSEKQRNKRSDKKESQRDRRRQESGKHPLTTIVPATATMPSQKSPLGLTAAQNEEWVKANAKKTKGRLAAGITAKQAGGPLDRPDFYQDEAGIYSGWKDVEVTRRKATVMTLSSNAIARVIGRGGANINAIREATQASIEVEKQNTKREQTERQITIRGTADTVRNAIQMINGLVIDQESSVGDIIRQVMRSGSVSTGSADSSEGNRSQADFKKSPSLGRKHHDPATATAPTTNIWQQRMAAAMAKEAEAAAHSTSPTLEHRRQMLHSAKAQGPASRPSAMSRFHGEHLEESCGSSSLTTPSPPVSPPVETPAEKPAPQPVVTAIARPVRQEPAAVPSADLPATTVPERQEIPNVSANIFSTSVAPTSQPEGVKSHHLPALGELPMIDNAPVSPGSFDYLTQFDKVTLPELNLAASFANFTTPTSSALEPMNPATSFLPGPSRPREEPSNGGATAFPGLSISNIWGSLPGIGEHWGNKPVNNGFGAMKYPAESHIQDWGAAAAVDPQLAFTQQKNQAPSQSSSLAETSTTASKTFSTPSASNGSLLNRSREPALPSGSNGWTVPAKPTPSMPQQQQQPTTSSFARPGPSATNSNNVIGNLAASLAQARTFQPAAQPAREARPQPPMPEQFYSLAAQIAAAQKPPVRPAERPQPPVVPSYNQQTAVNKAAPKHFNTYQASQQEFDPLTHVLPTYTSTHHQQTIVNGADFQGNRHPRPTGYGGYPGAPPGFGPGRPENGPTSQQMRGYGYPQPPASNNPPMPSSQMHPVYSIYNGPSAPSGPTWNKPPASTPQPPPGSPWGGWN
ncbi:unnamed protein product, partial [Mesorhabditis spiculigera]